MPALCNLTKNHKQQANNSNNNFLPKAAPPKRFYRQTGVVTSNGKFEITLDQRKLKTPKGAPFFVESEPLAIAIATEWDAQKDIIDRSRMHLTALSSTVIDNPNNLNKQDIVNYLVNYTNTDAILYQSNVGSHIL